jgi:phosphoglycolate phosphatase-like HAD superfamily hydrolase
VRRFVKTVAFDFGHTLVNEHTLDELMPGVGEVLPGVVVPMSVWANTRTAAEASLRERLRAVQIESYFSWVVTSIDAGFRKPAPEFFQFALSKCPYVKSEVLFVSNQLNTDVLGAESFGIRTAWLSAPEFRSADETMTLDDVRPSFILSGFWDLPSLLSEITI